MSDSWAERVVREVTGCRLPRWAIVTAVLGAFSLIMVLICMSILLIGAENNLDEQRKDATCRADVTLQIGLATADLVDAISRNPRDPAVPGPAPAVAAALDRLHLVNTAALALQSNRDCGYGGFIPTPTTTTTKP